MKNFLFAVILLVIPITSICQTTPYIKRVKAIVLHQYEYTGVRSYYCNNRPLLIDGSDTLVFVINSSVNCEMIASNKEYENRLGKSDAYRYNYWKELDERNPIHNLSFSKYDFLDPRSIG
ncbi:MAG: hypothetical protein Q8909_04830 [Bacteroidota bacterium]|nr:hypothetical protein [Bacteroidota bacterium]